MSCLKNQRNETFDILRGVTIILVVIGHSGCPNYLRNLIYLFHMPVFYFISGYFFNKNDKINSFQFIKRKINTLYKPFLVYSFIFLLLSNTFSKLYLTNDVITSKVFLQKTFNILMFKNSFMLLPFWFLRSLFIVNIMFLIQYVFIKRINISDKYILIIGIILYIIGSYYCVNNIHLPLEIQREFILLFFFILGYFYKSVFIPRLKYDTLVMFISLIICANFVKIDLAYSIIYNPILLIVCSVFGITLIVDLCYRLKKIDNKFVNLIKRILCICGKYSLIIFALHLLCFKLISFIIIKCYDLNINELSNFPTVRISNSYWWIAYSIVGVIIPLSLKILFIKINKYNNHKHEQSFINRYN